MRISLLLNYIGLMVVINYFSYRDEDIFHQRQQETHSGSDKQKHRNSILALPRFVGLTQHTKWLLVTPCRTGGCVWREGHHQQTAQVSQTTFGPSLHCLHCRVSRGGGDDQQQSESTNYLKQRGFKSHEGNVSQWGNQSSQREKRSYKESLVSDWYWWIGRDFEWFSIFHFVLRYCMILSLITNIYHRSYPSCCCRFFTIFCSFSLFLALHLPWLL